MWIYQHFYIEMIWLSLMLLEFLSCVRFVSVFGLSSKPNPNQFNRIQLTCVESYSTHCLTSHGGVSDFGASIYLIGDYFYLVWHKIETFVFVCLQSISILFIPPSSPLLERKRGKGEEATNSINCQGPVWGRGQDDEFKSSQSGHQEGDCRQQ